MSCDDRSPAQCTHVSYLMSLRVCGVVLSLVSWLSSGGVVRRARRLPGVAFLHFCVAHSKWRGCYFARVRTVNPVCVWAVHVFGLGVYVCGVVRSRALLRPWHWQMALPPLRYLEASLRRWLLRARRRCKPTAARRRLLIGLAAAPPTRVTTGAYDARDAQCSAVRPGCFLDSLLFSVACELAGLLSPACSDRVLYMCSDCTCARTPVCCVCVRRGRACLPPISEIFPAPMCWLLRARRRCISCCMRSFRGLRCSTS
jgi:hypothetical protein